MLHNVLLPDIKRFRHKTRIQFNNTSLGLDKKNYATKIAHAYIDYVVDYWPRNLLTNFTLKTCLFGATNIIENSDESKYNYSGHGIEFDGAGSQSFGNDFTKNVVIFSDNNRSSSDHRKNSFLVLGEGPANGFNDSVGTPEKKFRTNFTKGKKKFGLRLHQEGDSNYLFINGKKICTFKADNKNVNFPIQFCLMSTSEEFVSD